MHFVYIDDSKDEKLSCFSAILINANKWRDVFDKLKAYRKHLKSTDGIYVKKEFHATEFVAGRGRIAPSVVVKHRRCQIFMEMLTHMADPNDIKIINACGARSSEQLIFERMLNRINTNVSRQHSHALLCCDQGNEVAYTKLVRKMAVYNPIPSMYTAGPGRNLPISSILEDPIFKVSTHSYFIQLADFCAFSLLRSERPTAAAIKYGFDKAFDCLDPVLVKQAFGKDPRKKGIIRDY